MGSLFNKDPIDLYHLMLQGATSSDASSIVLASCEHDSGGVQAEDFRFYMLECV